MLSISRTSVRRSLQNFNLPAGKHETQALRGQGPARDSVSAVRAEGMDGAPARANARAGTGGGIDGRAERAACRGEGTLAGRGRLHRRAVLPDRGCEDLRARSWRHAF